ncbi:MAG: hypothetical protein M1820_002443 [Bogoriella megaspora]|nr:MAG: hypothetical protein M1820_002443 [Bogoriella megaspora]
MSPDRGLSEYIKRTNNAIVRTKAVSRAWQQVAPSRCMQTLSALHAAVYASDCTGPSLDDLYNDALTTSEPTSTSHISMNDGSQDASSKNLPSRKDNAFYVHQIHAVQTPAEVAELVHNMRLENINIWMLRQSGTDELFEKLLSVALCKQSCLKGLWDYALEVQEQNPANTYIPLYETIVAHRFSHSMPGRAYKWHSEIQGKYPVPPDSLIRLLKQILTSTSRLSRGDSEKLEKIYMEGSRRDLYDYVVPLLHSVGDYKNAYRFHIVMLRNGDYPSPKVAQSSNIVSMTRHYLQNASSASPDSSSALKLLPDSRDSSQSKSHDIASLHAESISKTLRMHMTRESMSRHLGDVHGFSEKPIDDSMCARLFATKFIPIQVIISGLAAFGVDVIGPLALRELAVRASNRTDLRSAFRALKQCEVSVKSCVYSRLLLMATYEGDDELLESIVSTDQHPDVFEDMALQQQLFQNYVASNDWVQARRASVILAFADEVNHTMSGYDYAWNLLLRTSKFGRKDQAIERILEQVQVNSAFVASPSVTHFCRQYMKSHPRRRPDLWINQYGKVEPTKYESLTILVNLLLRVHKTNRRISPFRWREVLRRLISLGRFQEFARLCQWLAVTYAEQHKAPSTPSTDHASEASTVSDHVPIIHKQDDPLPAVAKETNPSTLSPANPLSIIFTKKLLFSVIANSFTALVPPENRKVSADWSSHSRLDRINRTISTHPFQLPMQGSDVEDPELYLWTAGLALLHTLHFTYGVPISTAEVRGILMERLWILFGTKNLTRWENRLLRRWNPHSLTEMVRIITDEEEGVWPGLFASVPPLLYRGDAVPISFNRENKQDGRNRDDKQEAGYGDEEREADLYVTLFGRLLYRRKFRELTNTRSKAVAEGRWSGRWKVKDGRVVRRVGSRKMHGLMRGFKFKIEMASPRYRRFLRKT